MLARYLVASALGLAALHTNAYAQSYQLTTRLDNYCSADLPSFDFYCGIPRPGPMGARADNNGNDILDVYEAGRLIEMTLVGPNIPEGYTLIPTSDATLRIDAFGDLDSDPLPPEDPDQIVVSDYFDHEWIEIDMDGFDLGRTFDGDLSNDRFNIGVEQGWWGPGNDRGGLWDQGNAPDNLYGVATIPSNELAPMLTDGEILFTLGMATGHNDLTESAYFSNREEYIQFTLTFDAELAPLDTGPVLTAQFESSSTIGFAPLDISFDASSSIAPAGGISSFDWTFGEGEPSQGETVSHTFNTPGVYEVGLTVSDTTLGTSTATVSIEVLDPADNQDPTAAISASVNTPEAAEEVVFSGSDSSDPENGQLTFVWVIADETVGTEEELTHTFDTEGEHVVTLTVSDPLGATATTTSTITVIPPNANPIALFDATPSIVAAGETVLFDSSRASDPDGEITLHAWDFGDGNYAQGVNVEHSFEVSGEYEVTLTVSDDSGESVSSSQLISVTAPVLGAGGTFEITPTIDIGTTNNPANNPIRFSKWDHGFFKFPLDEVTGTITSATLQLYTRSEGEIETTVWAAGTDDWDEISGRPDAVGFSWFGTAALGMVNHTGPGYVELDVTDFIDQQLNGDGIASFELSSNSGAWLKYDSSEGDITPLLTIVTGAGEPLVSTPVEGSIKLATIGDSITQGSSALNSYRYSLWKKLLDAGIDVDFVGSEAGNSGGNPDWETYLEQGFDSDNEGHWGWRTDQVADNLPAWLVDYDADIALVHLGSNDLLQNQTVDSTIIDIENVVGALRADNPSISILIAQITPMSETHSLVSADHITQLSELNTQINTLVANLNSTESRVLVIDQFTGFDADLHTVDGVHPNAEGEEIIATRWLAAIEQALTPPDTGSIPVAVIRTSTLSGTPSLTVDFDASGSTDTDGDITSYEWDFAGLGSNDQQTTAFVFDAIGTYEVVLTVTDSLGNEATDSVTITVAEENTNLPPSADLISTTTQTETGIAVTFDGQGSSDPEGEALTYEWSVDGAVQPTSSSSLSYSFTQVGTFRVSLTVTDSINQQASSFVDVEVVAANTAPFASFLAQPSSVMTGEAIQFDASGSSDDDDISSYSWSFGDGETASGVLIQHSYTNAGTYTVTLTVTDSNNVSTSVSSDVSVIATTPAQPVSITLEPTLDIGATGIVENYPLVISQWDHAFFKFPLDEVTGPIESATFRLYVDSTTALETTVWAAGSDDWNASTGRPASVGYAWLGTNPLGAIVHQSKGYIEFDITSFVNEQLDEDGVITLEVTTDSGSWQNYDSFEGSNPPELIIETSSSVPAPIGTAPTALATASVTSGQTPLTVAFDASESTDPDSDIVSYLWDFAGLQSSSNVTPTYIFEGAGAHEVELTVTDSEGSSHSVTITINAEDPEINDPPSAVSTASTLLASPGELITFDSTGSIDPENESLSFVWELGDLSTASGATVIHSYSNEGTYDVLLKVSDPQGAYSHAEALTVEIATAPLVLFVATPETAPTNQAISFDAQGSFDDGTIETYAWDFGDGQTGEGISASHIYTTAGQYTVTLTLTDNQGASASNSTIVTIDEADPIAGGNFTLQASDDIGASGNADSSLLQISQWGHGFIRFPLTEVTGAVDSATLRIYYEDSAGTVETQAWAADSDDWNENTGGPEAIGHSWFGTAPIGVASQANVGYVEIDVTSFIEEQYNADQVASFEISTDQGGWLDYTSSEGNQPPELIINTTGAD